MGCPASPPGSTGLRIIRTHNGDAGERFCPCATSPSSRPLRAWGRKTKTFVPYAPLSPPLSSHFLSLLFVKRDFSSGYSEGESAKFFCALLPEEAAARARSRWRWERQSGLRFSAFQELK